MGGNNGASGLAPRATIASNRDSNGRGGTQATYLLYAATHSDVMACTAVARESWVEADERVQTVLQNVFLSSLMPGLRPKVGLVSGTGKAQGCQMVQFHCYSGVSAIPYAAISWRFMGSVTL